MQIPVPSVSDVKLGPTEVAVLRVLLSRTGKVTGRADLNRLAGIEGSPRRSDAALVLVRRALGEGAVVTVRRRGWMLHTDSLERARSLLDSLP